MQAKVALVTGGSRGIGREIALSLAGKGIDVILTYQNRADDANRVVADIERHGRKATALQLDLSGSASLDPFMARLKAVLRERWHTGAIDFLVNNAGMGAAVPIAEITEEIFDAFMNVHFKGVVFLTQKCLGMMNDDGGVIFITAAATRFVVPSYATYAACKSAVETFSRYVAREYGTRGIRANVVAPGGIETDFAGAIIRNTPELQAWVKAQTALGRVGQVDDIGGVVAFLCTNDAKWINGQRIEVTGGIHL
ncbi:Short-chain dehydrogenase/reductase SDR [Caballeronia peredens]|nr:Short-chain dehydrogenase/reductase SDR [Caballeronia peredens]